MSNSSDKVCRKADTPAWRTWRQRRRFRLVVALTALAICTASCDRSTAPPFGWLRLHNAGPAPLAALTVLFPEGEVSFGDVPAGTTTDYRAVPGGVYRYAAYRFVHEGSMTTQPVEDWVGEVPMRGERFTYTLEFNPTSGGDPFIALVMVTQDQ